MPIFVEGKEIRYTFKTPNGDVDTQAFVRIAGTILELEAPLVYPEFGDRLELGISGMLGIVRLIMELARLEGFERLIVAGHRTTGAVPGRAVLVDRRIR